ncbi:MAG: extradiol ring-cleavage dioxygenase [Deltaproteobacteria bacterium]|nr:extradiol ring-cleavage dioxygenase [Deltaproteobacteria bacterium]MBM4296816.1 extradiol ring-cleavage dioxygenase [Deltaproteobacteria bacterium]
MAKVVIGIGTSHSPQLSIRAKDWAQLLGDKDKTDPRLNYDALLKKAKPGIESELTLEKFEQRDQACLKGVATLGDALRQANADVVVVFGDDQQEQFHDENMPTFAIYHGKSVPVVKDHGLRPSGWKDAERRGWAETEPEYENAQELANHLIRGLNDAEFDIARCSKLRAEIGVGHAFSFLYRRVLPGSKVPIVPVMVNTYYPPNQPTPKRCYAFGQAVRKAIDSWNSDARVALLASGGLSHVVIDEEIDAMTIDGLKNKKPDVLFRLPRERLKAGTSEILNWVALAGAMEDRDLKYLEYVTTYRSPAGTGCGMGFAYWQ